MTNSEIITLNVEKLTSAGVGLARDNNFVFFIKNACPGDILSCKIIKRNKNYAIAEIVEILKPSPYRVEPRCKLHKICGGCGLQHISYDAQLTFKQQLLNDTLFSILKIKLPVKKIISTGEIWNYRHKIQYPTRSKTGNSRILAGYFKEGTHELINVKHCPIQPEEIDFIIEFIKFRAEELGILGYNEKSRTGILKHIVIRRSYYNRKNLIILVLNISLKDMARPIYNTIKTLSEDIYNRYEDVSGVSINYNCSHSNVILGDITKNIIGDDYIKEKLSDAEFNISADTFFQVNPQCANKMFQYIKDFINSNFSKPIIFDAYAGIAAFGITLSRISKYIYSVELNKNSIAKARETISLLNINNVETICSDTQSYLSTHNCMFDISIIDPPRKGCEQTFLNELLKKTKEAIIYVSCNPATMARDLKYIMAAGGEIISIQPFDMFPQTPHIECVTLIKLKNDSKYILNSLKL